MARSHLSAPSTSTPGELAFQISARHGRKERSGLSSGNQAMPVFLKDKL